MVYTNSDFRIHVVDALEMKTIKKNEYEDRELVKTLLGRRETNNIKEIEESLTDIGLDLSMSIDTILDKQDFIDSYVRNVLFEDETERLEIEKVDPHPSNEYEKGHPDYIIEKGYANPTIYLEMKKNSDGLRKSQFEWILDSIGGSDDVWVIWVEEL